MKQVYRYLWMWHRALALKLPGHVEVCKAWWLCLCGMSYAVPHGIILGESTCGGDDFRVVTVQIFHFSLTLH